MKSHLLPSVAPLPGIKLEEWSDWRWQVKNSLKTPEQFSQYFDLTNEEIEGFANPNFKVQVTPYYAKLASTEPPDGPIRSILMPNIKEKWSPYQEMKDPLGENRNRPHPRIIHRYPDRLLLLVTDFCTVYCRYCTRKHFTGKDQVFLRKNEMEAAIQYIQSQKEVREVILSGGDPLTLSDERILSVVEKLYQIDHLDLIRIGTRMPVVAPMRITEELILKLKSYHPIYFMVHFNHPNEVTAQAGDALKKLVDNGFPVFNQMVLLNGINNHPKLVEELSRKLLRLRVKPYYMFQCDPSEGTDHLRTSVNNSLEIQRSLWGRLSGLALPNLSLDIPGGGGKVGLVPDFLLHKEGNVHHFRGWDGVYGQYIDPPESQIKIPKNTHS